MLKGKDRSPVCWVLVFIALSASAGAAADSVELATRMETAIQETMKEHRLPSLSVAVAIDGEVVYADAHGLADLENNVAATADTVYRLGSVTKTVTAVTALSLAEQGKLDLDVSIQRYCPAFPVKEHEITSRQLLAHLAGIRHYDYRRFEEDFLNKKAFSSIEESLSKFAGDPLLAPPGTAYHYSSWGYVLIGCAIEGADGTSFDEAIRNAVLRPARMTQTMLDNARAIIPHRANGYSGNDDGSWSNVGWFDSSDRIAAGGLVGKPADLARFGAALLQGELLGTDSLENLWSSQSTASGESTGAGLGWKLSESGDEVFHGGTTVGGSAYFYIQPDQGVVVAFATNLSLWTKGRHEFAQQLATIVSGQ